MPLPADCSHILPDDLISSHITEYAFLWNCLKLKLYQQIHVISFTSCKPSAGIVPQFIQAWPHNKTSGDPGSKNRDSICVCMWSPVVLDIQVNSCLPKCHFLSPTISHAHKPTQEVPHAVWHTCLALGCNEHISSQIPSTTEVQQNHWPQQPPKYTCTNFSGTVLLVRLLRCGLSWQLSFWELNSVKASSVYVFLCVFFCMRACVCVCVCASVHVKTKPTDCKQSLSCFPPAHATNPFTASQQTRDVYLKEVWHQSHWGQNAIFASTESHCYYFFPAKGIKGINTRGLKFFKPLHFRACTFSFRNLSEALKHNSVRQEIVHIAYLSAAKTVGLLQAKDHSST